MDSFLVKNLISILARKIFQNFPISNIKDELAIYTDFFALGQIVPNQHSPKNIGTHQ